ncbi:MAG TPA: 4Fe-4S binding protein [Candidatus Pelethocola excrementipullorum]|nr:4Fe-4S binding protein [Candidatus Pelethocola excrementipullorum]
MATLTVSAQDEKRVKGMGFLSNKGTDNFSGRIITVNGKITAQQMKSISEAAEKFGNGVVTFTTRLTVEVQGVPYEKIEEFKAYIESAGLAVGGTGPKVRPVVSCKGTTCQYGLIDTFALSEEVHHRFYEGYSGVKLHHKFKIAVGGCPNNCVKPDLNDLGIIGQMIPEYVEESCRGCKKCSVEDVCPTNAAKVGEQGVLEIDEENCINCGRCVGSCPFGAFETGKQGYKVYIGGRWGKKVSRGQELRKIFFDKEEAMSVIEKTILLYKEQGKPGERFSETIERLGFEKVESQLLSDEILERKQEILEA